MVTRIGPFLRARQVASDDERRDRSDLRLARLNAGLSREAGGQVVGLPRSAIERIETGARRTTLAEYAALGAAVGIEVRLRAYPAGDPIRDAGQQRLLERFRGRILPGLTWRTEVPLPIDGDLRARDAVIGGRGWRCHLDAETVLEDFQALERRLERKRRDGGADHVILLVADTRRKSRALAAAPSTFGGMSRNARTALGAPRRGSDPGRDAIILV